MCNAVQSLLIDMAMAIVGTVLRQQHLGRHFSFFGGDGNSGNPGRVPGIVRLEEIRGVVPDDEETRVNGGEAPRRPAPCPD